MRRLTARPLRRAETRICTNLRLGQRPLRRPFRAIRGGCCGRSNLRMRQTSRVGARSLLVPSIRWSNRGVGHRTRSVVRQSSPIRTAVDQIRPRASRRRYRQKRLRPRGGFRRRGRAERRRQSWAGGIRRGVAGHRITLTPQWLRLLTRRDVLQTQLSLQPAGAGDDLLLEFLRLCCCTKGRRPHRFESPVKAGFDGPGRADCTSGQAREEAAQSVPTSSRYACRLDTAMPRISPSLQP
jgi:hypothetical protein